MRAKAKLLRVIGVVLLLVGTLGSDLVYWLRTRSPSAGSEVALDTNEKAYARQMETLVGKQGLVVQEWSEKLSHPGAQAILMGVTCLLASGGCFYIAGLMARDAESK